MSLKIERLSGSEHQIRMEIFAERKTKLTSHIADRLALLYILKVEKLTVKKAVFTKSTRG